MTTEEQREAFEAWWKPHMEMLSPRYAAEHAWLEAAQRHADALEIVVLIEELCDGSGCWVEIEHAGTMDAWILIHGAWTKRAFPGEDVANANQVNIEGQTLLDFLRQAVKAKRETTG